MAIRCWKWAPAFLLHYSSFIELLPLLYDDKQFRGEKKKKKQSKCMQIPHYRSLLLMNKAIAAVGMWDLALSVTCAAERETVDMADLWLRLLKISDFFQVLQLCLMINCLIFFFFFFFWSFFSFLPPFICLFVCLFVRGKKLKRKRLRGIAQG